VADDAVSCEPVSGPNSLLTREINREFCRIWPFAAISTSSQRVNSIASSQIPYTTKQGISKRVSGKFFGGTGIQKLPSWSSPRAAGYFHLGCILWRLCFETDLDFVFLIEFFSDGSDLTVFEIR